MTTRIPERSLSSRISLIPSKLCIENKTKNNKKNAKGKFLGYSCLLNKCLAPFKKPKREENTNNM